MKLLHNPYAIIFFLCILVIIMTIYISYEDIKKQNFFKKTDNWFNKMLKSGIVFLTLLIGGTEKFPRK